MGIAALFKQTALRLPDKVAFEFEEQRVTFKEIDTAGNKVANALQSIGVVKGDRVAQFMPNSLEPIYSLVGNFKNGSIVVPMNASFKEQEILHILKAYYPWLKANENHIPQGYSCVKHLLHTYLAVVVR